ncbi:Crp/Fnr family transcriptional regulator [Microvirga lenta]|uniref:Crp/Fnr family transcriptional regulator n=1 Tax=Microvirga lenta TaxID=2881337 RepID=UPI001CFFB9A9|nr:Crp/Fnr family transcriptional regulator [Microvirga lenta]MCB5177336.1 Crp/Fnr family transcriptional regulator [Microvirga lenta]
MPTRPNLGPGFILSSHSSPSPVLLRDQHKSDAPFRNRLLQALPQDVADGLRPRLERVELKRRQILHERHIPLTHAYFLEQGAASLLLRAGDEGVMEVSTLGRSDFVGVPLVMNSRRTPCRCMVQAPGSALRIEADDLENALAEFPALHRLLLGYAQAAMTEAAQLAVCNSCHNLKQRLARSLLVASTRLGENELPLTHEILSRALGVRRASVTIAMGQMEEAGIVSRGRGRVEILDRPKLEAEACGCHRILCGEYRRLVCTGDDAQRNLPWSSPYEATSSVF